MHIVSNVQGEVRDDVDALDVLKQLSQQVLSGAPKIVRWKLLIVEPVKRGILVVLLVI